MIKVKNLVKTFGGVRALDGLNVNVGKGTIYGLVGPNGAGKTTVLKHIAGVYRPDSGEVLVGGYPVFEDPAAKADMAFIPSDFYYYRQARICDMRDLHAALFPRFSRQRFDELTGLFDLDQSRNVRSLSKGMTKQLAFWLALAQRPDVLLLDEPLDGLDPAARHIVLGKVMEEVAERQMTVLVSSHNLRELADVCDYVGIMEAGRMRLERSLADLQGNFVKIQVAFEDDSLPSPLALDVVSASVQGRLHTLVARASADEAESVLGRAGATFVNVLPLSLEEIFIYEIGGSHHEDGLLD